MIINYNNFLFEKLGINDDVMSLVNFLLQFIYQSKDKKLTIAENIPKTTFKINKIIIEFINNKDVDGAFIESRSKLTNKGYDLYLMINKDSDIKSNLYHELTHVIKYQNLTNKKIKFLAKNNITYIDKRFDNLIYLLYYSDDSEINAKVAEIYSKIEENIELSSKSIDKKLIFKTYMNKLKYDRYDSPYMLINYNIFEDLRDVSDKDKIKFFSYITNIKNIKRSTNNKILMIYRIIKYIIKNDYTINSDLDSIMLRTQKHINYQGEKLLRKIMKLYNLFEQK